MTYALMMLRDAEVEGVDLLAGSGVSRAELEASESISASLAQRVTESYTNWNDHPDWAFRFGARLGIVNHGPLGFGALAAPDVEQGLRFLARYIGVRAAQAVCDPVAEGDGLRLLFTVNDATEFLGRIAETLAMVFQSYLESVGASAAPTVWHFPYREPAHGAAYGHWLHGGYRFEARQLCLDVPRSVLMVSSTSQDQTSLQACENQCETLLAKATGPLEARVEQLLGSAIRTRLTEASPLTDIPTIDALAARFNVSRRTLIRHLQAADTSYRDIKDRLLRQLIRQCLQTGMPVQDIAERLGYTDSGNFTRACRRLLGQSPSALRHQLPPVSLFQ